MSETAAKDSAWGLPSANHWLTTSEQRCDSPAPAPTEAADEGDDQLLTLKLCEIPRHALRQDGAETEVNRDGFCGWVETPSGSSKATMAANKPNRFYCDPRNNYLGWRQVD